MGGEVRGFLTGLALVAGLLLVLASAPLVLPGQAVLQSLRFHLAGGVAVLAVLLILGRARWRGVALLLAAGASLAQGGLILVGQQQAHAALAGREAAVEFDLLSFNLLISNRNGTAIADMLLARAPQVAVLLEAAPVFGELERLAALYPYRLGCASEARCDTLMLSQTPLTQTRIESASPFSAQRVILAVTEIGGERVNLVAVHMTKPYFDYGAEMEVHWLTQRLARLEGPVVLAGDFNAAPWSRSMQRLIGNAGLVTAGAYPATWPTALGPLGVPIDAVLARPPALVADIAALEDPMGSNHRGLAARIRLMR